MGGLGGHARVGNGFRHGGFSVVAGDSLRAITHDSPVHLQKSIELRAALRNSCASEGKKCTPARPRMNESCGTGRGPRERVGPSTNRRGAAMRTDEDVKRNVENELKW